MAKRREILEPFCPKCGKPMPREKRGGVVETRPGMWELVCCDCESAPKKGPTV